MPIIDGLESTGLWGNENVLPRDKENGIEDNQWCYWGGNPVAGKDGKYHIAICRWPEDQGHHGWFKSEVAHCISDTVLGPYKVSKTIVAEGHNPEVLKLQDGSYALHVLNRNRVYTADRMSGPWKLAGSMRLDAQGFREHKSFGSNLTTEYRPDGSILVMKKDGDVAISNTGVCGPYKIVSIQNYARGTGYAEDPVVWRSRHQYHAVYNHAQDRRSAYMRSLDGIHWKNEYGLPYDASTTFYVDGSENKWHKFERPKVLQDQQGRASHLSLAVMDVAKNKDKGDDIHSSKNIIIPLAIEKLVSFTDGMTITAETKRLQIKIQAEDNFDPLQDLDMGSLRFGSDSVVNFGGGCVAVDSRADGRDLIVTFEGHHGRTHLDFDFKLLGRTKAGDLVVGYALLPGKSPLDASLITTLPVVEAGENQGTVAFEVQNFGLSVSQPGGVNVYAYQELDRKLVHTVDVPALKPYAVHAVKIELDQTSTDTEYEVVIPGTEKERWRTVGLTDESVQFCGQWKQNRDPDQKCFLRSEQVSTTFGDKVTFSFTGTRARAYGRTARPMGTFKVILDGQHMETVRCNYSALAHEKIYQTPLLSPGKHTLTLEKVKADFNKEVAIDSFAFESVDNLP